MTTKKKIYITLAVAMLVFATVAIAQSPAFSSSPPSAPNISVGTVGVTGITQYWYVVVAHYPGGTMSSGVVTIGTANATLTSGNYNVIGWSALPNALNYDVLRLPTSSSGAFTGVCTCSLATAISASTVTYSDIGGSVSAYTLSAGAVGATGFLYADTTRYATPKLRVLIQGGGGTIADHLAEIASGVNIPSYSVPGDLFVKTGGAQPGVYYSPTANAYTLSGITAQDCGTTTTCAATNQSTSWKVVRGSAALSSGTPSTAAVTGISPAFTSATTYTCVAQDASTIATNIGVLTAGYVSGSAVTFTGPNTNTDAFRYVCEGN